MVSWPHSLYVTVSHGLCLCASESQWLTACDHMVSTSSDLNGSRLHGHSLILWIVRSYDLMVSQSHSLTVSKSQSLKVSQSYSLIVL